MPNITTVIERTYRDIDKKQCVCLSVYLVLLLYYAGRVDILKAVVCGEYNMNSPAVRKLENWL